MKLYTEFIVMHEDGPLPGEENFCPSFWRAEDFDSDGDYYYDNIDGRWTNLVLTRRQPDGRDSILNVNTFREQRLYEPGTQEVEDLGRYIAYQKEGRYTHNQKISAMKNLAVTALAIQTFDLEDYREFLVTVHFFLESTEGIVVNFLDLDAASFKEEFLSDPTA